MSPIFTAIDKQANIFTVKWSSYSWNEFTTAIIGYDIRVFRNSVLLALRNIGKNMKGVREIHENPYHENGAIFFGCDPSWSRSHHSFRVIVDQVTNARSKAIS